MSSILPLAADPFPPTHVAGSEFEGFFFRLQSHAGRSASKLPYSLSNSAQDSATSPRSRIPRLAATRHARSESSSSSGPPSPTPSPKTLSDRTQPKNSMLTASQPYFASSSLTVSPDSYASVLQTRASKGSMYNGNDASMPKSKLPTVAPADLIVVICELQSAPIEQRVCVYVRWIVHGEEEKQRDMYRPTSNGTTDGLSSSGPKLTKRRGSKRPPNANVAATSHAGESFELTIYVPKWILKLGPLADSKQVQPFRLELPCPDKPGESYGFMSVTKTGNVTVDLTAPNDFADGAVGGTRVRIRTHSRLPWCSTFPFSKSLPMGSKGPESWIQHLGLLLPLHWYVHTSSSPATFSVEHVEHGYAVKGHNDTLDAVAAGRASLHVEKNWGQSFPVGWMWISGSSPLEDASTSPSRQRTHEPPIRLTCAGGSILGLTAFLIGIRVDDVSQKRNIEWDFTPPFALGPGLSFADGPTARIHYGLGFTIHRDFTRKTLEIQVWDYRRWARIVVHGDEHTFATQLPGPVSGGWAPGYCHQSYRCQAKITLFERPILSIPGSIVSAAIHPTRTLRSLTNLLSRRKADQERNTDDMQRSQQKSRSVHDEAWCSATGWNRIGEYNLEDRVALEFGGDFAK